MAPSYVCEPQNEGPPNKKTAQPQVAERLCPRALKAARGGRRFSGLPLRWREVSLSAAFHFQQAVCVEVVGVTGRGGVSRGRLAPHLPGS